MNKTVALASVLFMCEMGPLFCGKKITASQTETKTLREVFEKMACYYFWYHTASSFVPYEVSENC